MERAGICMQALGLRSQRNISEAKVTPEEHEISTPDQDLQTRAPGPGRGACIAAGSKNQQELSAGRGGNLLESQVLS